MQDIRPNRNYFLSLSPFLTDFSFLSLFYQDCDFKESKKQKHKTKQISNKKWSTQQQHRSLLNVTTTKTTLCNQKVLSVYRVICIL